jgi:hypothetical protein
LGHRPRGKAHSELTQWLFKSRIERVLRINQRPTILPAIVKESAPQPGLYRCFVKGPLCNALHTVKLRSERRGTAVVPRFAVPSKKSLKQLAKFLAVPPLRSPIGRVLLGRAAAHHWRRGCTLLPPKPYVLMVKRALRERSRTNASAGKASQTELGSGTEEAGVV